jgi:hypothetical protein
MQFEYLLCSIYIADEHGAVLSLYMQKYVTSLWANESWHLLYNTPLKILIHFHNVFQLTSNRNTVIN